MAQVLGERDADDTNTTAAPPSIAHKLDGSRLPKGLSPQGSPSVPHEKELKKRNIAL